MPTGSYLTRRAIYQSLHGEGMSDGISKMAQLPQVAEAIVDNSGVDKTRMDVGKKKIAGMKSDSATDIP